jgi:hypothetical protein
MEFVVRYSSKYKNKEFEKFVFILRKLKENSFPSTAGGSNVLPSTLLNKVEIKKSKFKKDEFIDLIKLIYTLNPDGKGKKRKRSLSEILSIIEDKNSKN